MVQSEVIQNKLKIAAIGFEIDVEDIAKHRHTSRNRVKTDIDQHLDELVARHAETPSLVDHDETDGGGRKIADAGDQTKDRVCPERHACTGNSERRIHQPHQSAHPAKARELFDGYVGLLHSFCLVSAPAIQMSCGSLMLAKPLDGLLKRALSIAVILPLAFARSAGTVRTVKRFGSRLDWTCVQVSGIGMLPRLHLCVAARFSHICVRKIFRRSIGEHPSTDRIECKFLRIHYAILLAQNVKILATSRTQGS